MHTFTYMQNTNYKKKLLFVGNSKTWFQSWYENRSCRFNGAKVGQNRREEMHIRIYCSEIYCDTK